MALRTDSSNLPALQDWVQRTFPGAQLKNAVGSTVTYELVARERPLCDYFRILQTSKLAQGILDYSLSQTTLEQVFLHFASEQEEVPQVPVPAR